ncbi:MAG TPA: glycosyltransferase family 39 protein [Acetobacteraceae bacterium]|nr:glycosyltransferase family 39 protein [Acetobacteraceae bacterium]
MPLILATTALRLAFAASLGLGVDESYMVAAGRILSVGYYDHPPAAWWLSWGAAHLFGSEAPVVVRLPFVVLFAFSTWLMYRLGAEIADERAGFWAAVLLNLAPVFGVTTGTWVLPDGPLDCALLAAALSLVHALTRGTVAWWLATGACAGLALLSKYSAVLTIAGAALYLMTSREHRHWLATPKPWLAALVALMAFAPVLAWNAAHDWVSFAFQGGRVAGATFHPLAPLITLGGEALFLLPWIWLPVIAVFAIALRRGPGDWRSWLLCCLGAPPIIAFAAVSAWSSQRVLFHWAAPGYLMLFPLLGTAVASRVELPVVRHALVGTAVFVVIAVAVVATQVRFDWLHPVIARVTHGDPDLDAVNWTSLNVPPGTIVGVSNWRDAGKIAYALGPQVTVLCLNRDARQFGITWPVQRFIGADVLILAPEHADRIVQEMHGAFASLDPLPDQGIRHAGRMLRSVAAFDARHLLAWPPR